MTGEKVKSEKWEVKNGERDLGDVWDLRPVKRWRGRVPKVWKRYSKVNGWQDLGNGAAMRVRMTNAA